ncbi:MAG: hypothetical protein A3G93_14315 [Nitrospinae bacterium RIFCSPLOWO2_12_FULL_45_22]|nr:MAG: hypothetical protein A3G93_14315 [Nitrospinae bacterium RIFCSPLOWO2_12_FULL_45_22]
MGKIYEIKRGRKYHYYYRHSQRIKLDGSQDGKGPGSGPSRVVTTNIYLGNAENIVRKLKGENISIS